jgi:hypothetical protein
MPRTVKDQTRGCFGCAVVIFAAFFAYIFFHRYIWREKEAPKDSKITQQRMSEINRDYYRFHDLNGRYPESFEELREAMGGGKRAYSDPWGSPYVIVERDGTVYVYSIGPDLTDDGMSIQYDPTNGVESTGDMFMILRRSGSSGG